VLLLRALISLLLSIADQSSGQDNHRHKIMSGTVVTLTASKGYMRCLRTFMISVEPRMDVA
jgi:hypothetical protein